MKSTEFNIKQPKKVVESAPVVQEQVTAESITFPEFNLALAESKFMAEGAEQVDPQQLQQSLARVQKFVSISAQFSKEQKYVFNDIEADIRQMGEMWAKLNLGLTGSDVDYAVKDAIEAINQALSAVYGVQEAVTDVAKSIQNTISDAEDEAEWVRNNPDELSESRKQKKITENATGGATGTSSVAVSMSSNSPTMVQSGNYPADMVNRQKSYTNQRTKSGPVKVKASK